MLDFFKRKKPTIDAPSQNNEEKESNLSSSPIEDHDTTTQESRGFFSKLKSGLSRTRKQFSKGIANLLLGKKSIDPELLENLETLLLGADIGIEVTDQIIESLTDQMKRRELKDGAALHQALHRHLNSLLVPCEQAMPFNTPEQGPTVILMIGINGAGKTTTIGKLAHQFSSHGQKVMLAAGDTFRAAAIEQLQSWGQRANIPVIAQQQGSDSASVIYDAYASAKAKGIDVLIADTAGRLHTQDNLMAELEKVTRVLKKLDASAPHEVMLVLDASIGQNALSQATQFHQSIGVTGLTITKLDGTAKGGIVFAIANALKLPIRYIGIGEGIEDLRPFSATDFVDALLEGESEEV